MAKSLIYLDRPFFLTKHFFGMKYFNFYLQGYGYNLI